VAAGRATAGLPGGAVHGGAAALVRVDLARRAVEARALGGRDRPGSAAGPGLLGQQGPRSGPDAPHHAGNFPAPARPSHRSGGTGHSRGVGRSGAPLRAARALRDHRARRIGGGDRRRRERCAIQRGPAGHRARILCAAGRYVRLVRRLRLRGPAAPAGRPYPDPRCPRLALSGHRGRRHRGRLALLSGQARLRSAAGPGPLASVRRDCGLLHPRRGHRRRQPQLRSAADDLTGHHRHRGPAPARPARHRRQRPDARGLPGSGHSGSPLVRTAPGPDPKARRVRRSAGARHGPAGCGRAGDSLAPPPEPATQRSQRWRSTSKSM